MEYVVSGYEPKRAFEIFEDLCVIPHGSGNETGIANYIEKFASNNGIFCLRDEVGNVFLRKNATRGYENVPAIMLQGHMDMVCEKNADSDHDFEHDGLKLSVKDGFLWADGTTLGADNGIAVAMMLALLETDSHPTLECLFTVEEETGLAGAQGFDCSVVTAKRMINLDSEEEWQITAGCAGGCRTEIDFDIECTEVSEGYAALDISITGLSGGHSGAEIHLGKTNAIIAMARLLGVASKKCDIRLVAINGGGKDNAIARECFATIVASDRELASNAIISESKRMKRELCAADESFCVSVQNSAAISCFDKSASTRVIYLLNVIKTGVICMSNHINGLVEYSRNAGIISTTDSKVRLTLSSRSSVEAQLDLSCRELDMLCELAEVNCHHYARYPGWEFEPASDLRKKYSEAYRSIYGSELQVGVIHAGLECGILSSKLDNMDIISVGPNMHDIHSPNEHLDLVSCEHIWNTLIKVITEK